MGGDNSLARATPKTELLASDGNTRSNLSHHGKLYRL